MGGEGGGRRERGVKEESTSVHLSVLADVQIDRKLPHDASGH